MELQNKDSWKPLLKARHFDFCQKAVHGHQRLLDRGVKKEEKRLCFEELVCQYEAQLEG